jgi:5-formyltetrahydrofolate cyclo-ligase
MKPTENPAIKRDLRRRMAEHRDAVPEEMRRELSGRLCRVAAQRLLDPLRERLGRPLAVCVYGAFRSEADPADLTAWCWSRGDAVFAPRVLADGSGMELRRIASPADWTAGRHGVPEPDPDRTEPLPDPNNLDAVLVPGLVFDRRGRRIGYGGGHYDRLYARVMRKDPVNGPAGRPLWIGFAFAFQVVEEPLPVEAHDLRLDGVATERGLFWCVRPSGE